MPPPDSSTIGMIPLPTSTTHPSSSQPKQPPHQSQASMTPTASLMSVTQSQPTISLQLARSLKIRLLLATSPSVELRLRTLTHTVPAEVMMRSWPVAPLPMSVLSTRWYLRSAPLPSMCPLVRRWPSSMPPRSTRMLASSSLSLLVTSMALVPLVIGLPRDPISRVSTP